MSISTGNTASGAGRTSSSRRLSIGRPLLSDGPNRDRAASAPGDDGHVPLAEVQSKNKLGTFLGVYLPCILSIFGAILFLRLPWAVGQAGVLGTLLIFALAGLTITLTVMSIAAISTNGNMKGGGAYYMISRALGPEFGGAVGLVFFAANTLGITFYLIAFASEIHSIIGGGHWMVTLYASSALFLLLLVGLGGAGIFAKLNFLVAICLVVSIIAALASFVFGEENAATGYTGFSADTFSENFSFGFTGSLSFFQVFVVVFPAMTGVMAGANMSGDLQDPGRSIGYGTMSAVVTALIVYTILLFVIGATTERSQLQTNYNIMQDVCFYKAFVAVGVVSSTVSSAMGNLVGSGRILQALARDNLFPCLTVFGWGSKKGDEPRVAVVCVWFIAQACLFIGDLNAVASIISGFFLLVYFFTNFACFVLRITGAPNFRPRFRYFTWHTALAGALLCFTILFISGALYATIAIIVVALLWVYVHYTAPVTSWGDVTQALIYHQVRKYLLRLDERRAHPKFWRPSVLLLCQNPTSQNARNLIDFGNNVKKGGMYVLGNVVITDQGNIRAIGSQMTQLRHLWLDFIGKAHLKAFHETTVAPDARTAYQNLILAAGVGGMKPNTVLIPFYSPPGEHADLEAGAVGVASPTPVSALEDGGGKAKRKFGRRQNRHIHTEPVRKAGADIARLTSSVSHNPSTPRHEPDEAKRSDEEAPGAVGMTACGTPLEYLNLLRDTLYLGRNVIIGQSFNLINKDAIESFSKRSKARGSRQKSTIDVWMTHDQSLDLKGSVSLQLQLAHILHLTDVWSDHTDLRMMVAVEKESEVKARRAEVEETLLSMRIDVDVWIVPVFGMRTFPIAAELQSRGELGSAPLANVQVVNELVRHNSEHTCLVFLTLPTLPVSSNATNDDVLAASYHTQIKELTFGLPASVLVASGGSSQFIASEI